MVDYNVVRPPLPASYAAPLVGMQLGEALAGLPSQYYKGAEEQRQYALSHAFEKGAPIDERGQLDLNKLAQTQIKYGDYSQVPVLAGLGIKMDAFRRAQQLDEEMSPSGATTGQRPIAPSAAGPGNINAVPQPSNIRGDVLPQTPKASTTAEGTGPTIRQITTELSGGKDTPGVISAVVRELRVGPDAELKDPTLESRARTSIANKLKETAGIQSESGGGVYSPSENNLAAETSTAGESSANAALSYAPEGQGGGRVRLASLSTDIGTPVTPTTGASGSPAPVSAAPETAMPSAGIMPNGPVQTAQAGPMPQPQQAPALPPQAPMGPPPGAAQPQPQIPPNSLLGIAVSQYGPQIGPQVAARVSQGMGVAPTQPLDPARAAQIQGAFAQAAGRQGQGVPAPQPRQLTAIADPSLGGMVPRSFLDKYGSDAPGRFIQNRYQKAQMLSIAGDAAGAQAATKQAQDVAVALQKASEPTGPMKEYIANRQPGESQSQYQARTAAEKQAAEGMAKRGATLYAAIDTQAKQYQTVMRPMIQISRGLLNDPDMYTGIGAELVLNYNRIKAAAFNDPKAAMMQEALKKVTATSVLSQINTQRYELEESGSNASRIFAQQVDLVEKSTPTISLTLNGNRFLIETSDRMGKASVALANLARDYLQGHPYLDARFDKLAQNYLEQHPIFTPEETAHPSLLGVPQVPDAIYGDLSAMREWKSAMKIKAGDYVRLPNGSYSKIKAETAATQAQQRPQPQSARQPAPQAAPSYDSGE